MFSSYFTIALRNLWKNKVYVFINSLALGISMASFIAAYLWVAYDREFDDFHKDEKVEHIYKLHAHWDGHQSILSPYPLGPAATSDIAGIQRFTRYSFEKGLVIGGDKGFQQGVGVADSTFYSMFDFPLVSGSLTSFNHDSWVIISKSLSEKLFGNENPIQKSISLKFGNLEPVNFLVGAVIQDIPHNTSFTFDLMIRIESYQKIKGIKPNNWGPWPAVSTFYEVSKGTQIADVNTLFQGYIESHELDIDRYTLEHFKANFTMTEILGAMVNVRMWQTPIRVLTIMAVVLFMIACFNLSNTSFSLMAQRMNEIGVRRALGASRNHIIFQFLLEISATILISLVIGLLMANIIVPRFADIWAQGIGNRWDTLVFRLDQIDQVTYLITLLILVILGVALAGIYPAIFFSKLKPVVIFKGDVKVGGTNWFSRILLVFQFSISLVMLIMGVMFIKNSHYMLSKEVGFDKDHIVYLKTTNEYDDVDFQQAVRQIPGVVQTTWTKDHLGAVSESKARIDGIDLSIRRYRVSEDYLDLMGVELKEGRPLLKSDFQKVVVTEKFAAQAHVENPIGRMIRMGNRDYRIVGVVGDVVDQWRMNDQQGQIPHVFTLASTEANRDYLVIRTHPDQAESVLMDVIDRWDEHYSTTPFYGGMMLKGGPYQSSLDMRNIFIFLTTMTLLLSCLGLYTLAALNVRKRLKEIGIRKVLGSSVFQILKRLNREFVVILMLSAVLGTSMSQWLLKLMTESNLSVLFIDGRWELLAGSASLLVLLGLATSVMIISRGANQDPANLLRNE